MKKILVIALVVLSFSTVYSQTRYNTTLLGSINFPNGLNDVWGYADANGNEFALVGKKDGFSIVDVTDPTSLVELMNIDGPFTSWRDIKTWNNHAYVVHDGVGPNGAQALMIVDLNNIKSVTLADTVTFRNNSVTFFTLGDSLTDSHNIFIDENGVAYLLGHNLGNRGAIMLDLTQDPEAPVYLGRFNDFYLHDGMVRGDTLWGSAVFNGFFAAIDVSNKANPVVLATKTTPNFFTHNSWISDDNNTLFTTDEVSNAYVASYDVSDLSNISELDRIQASTDTSALPHNTHVLGDFLVNSYYSEGLQIVDATRPHNMIEVAQYQTLSAWGAYPYLPSGNILVTDIPGILYVISSTYPKGCYLEGNISDSITGNAIFDADIEILTINDTVQSDFKGDYATAVLNSGNYTVVVSKSGYQPDTTNVTLSNGVLTILDVKLAANGISINEFEGIEVSTKIYPNPSSNMFTVEYEFANNISSNTKFVLTDITGQIVYESSVKNIKGKETFGQDLTNGVYLFRVVKDSTTSKPIKVIKAN